MRVKKYQLHSVLAAAQSRISEVFDNFERIYVSFSAGKDSTVMLHLVMDEAIKRNRKVGVLLIDLEAQYADSIAHAELMFEQYKDNIDPHWVAMPMLLRNALTNFEPRWMCWDPERQGAWVREKPVIAKTEKDYPDFQPGVEFEEFVTMFAEWYSQGKPTAGFIGIRADESLHRYCTVAVWDKTLGMFNKRRWTTKVTEHAYNIYPIYDWRTEDIWRYHGKYPNKPYNQVYDKMQMAGVKLSQQRLCQPYGDDQRRGLWLYHLLEPETWFKVVARVNGANSGALYMQESGNMTGYGAVTKPDGHSWRSFCNLLLKTMPKVTREHYKKRFIKFIAGWKKRGYAEIPDEAPRELEVNCWAPSWRRMCKVLLRNDYWCKGLGQTQPKSDAYGKFLALKKLAGTYKNRTRKNKGNKT